MAQKSRPWFSSLFAIDRLFVFKERVAKGRRKRSVQLNLERLEDRTTPAITLNPTTWTAIGPAPITGGQVPGAGAVSGRITGIATDVTDPNTIFVAAADGGVWKTTNGGTSWSTTTDNLTDSSGNPIPLFMGAVAETHGSGGNEVVYAGTGEANNAYDSYYGEGILVSTDGGATWTLTGQSQLQGTAISRIAVDPQNSNIAYAAVSNFAVNGTGASVTGIYKTTNGGGSWTNVTAANGKDKTDPWSDVVIDPTTTGGTAVLFAAVGNDNGAAGNGVYTSTDGGTTWSLVGGGLPSGSTVGRISLAVAHPPAAAKATLYASIAKTGLNGTLRNLEQSTDGGTTWTDIKANLGGDSYLTSQGGYDNVIEIDPTNTNEIFVAGVLKNQGLNPNTSPTAFSGGGIEESQNGGTTWTEVNSGTSTTPGNGPHSDYHALAFDASGNLVVGNDGGVWRLDSNDLTTPNVAWTDLNTDLEITQFGGIALDPTSANIAYGGTQDNGTDAFSGTLSWLQIQGGDGGITRLDPTNHNQLYQEFEGGITLQTSTNPTAASPTFTSISSGIKANTTGAPPAPIVNFVAPYVLDSSGDILFGTDYLNLSTNQGGSWTQIGTPGTNGFNPGDSAINAIAVAPSNIAVVYVSVGGNMFVTQNATAAAASVTWTAINLPSGSAGAPNSIAVDPSQPGTAYAVVNAFVSGGKRVFMTTNFGATWTDISGNLPNFPVDSIAIDPRGTPTSRIIYVGTDVGVYATINGGTTWASYATGLPNAQVVELDIAGGIVAAGTHGRGVFEIQQNPTPNPTTTVSLDSSGNLVIQDVFPGGKNDNLTIQADAATSMYIISDPTAIIGLAATIPPGATVSANNHTAFVPFADVTGTQIKVDTLGGNDKLTVDYSLGTFAKTVNYDGGTGTNSLVVEGELPSALPFMNDVDTATGAHSGLFNLDGSVIDYANLASLIDTATATYFFVNGTGAAGQTINVVDTPPPGTENGFPSDEVNSNDFTKVDFANKINLTVKASINAGLAAAGPTTFTVHVITAALDLSTLTLHGGGKGSTFNVQATPVAFSTTLDGSGTAGDAYNISSDAGVNNPPLGNLAGILGLVIVKADGSTTNRLIVSDQGNTTTADQVTITSASIKVIGGATATINYGAAGGGTFTDGGANDGILFLGANVAPGGNVFTVLSTLGGSSTLVDGGSGSDAFYIADGGLGVGSTDSFNGQGGNNSFFITSAPPVSAAVFIDGGTSSLNVLFGPNVNSTWNITGANQGNIGGAVTAFKDVQYLIGGTGDDTFVLSTGASEGTINGGYGNNTVVGAPDVINAFDITGGNAGDIVGTLAAFANVQNLDGSTAPGNTGTDVFEFFMSGGLAGHIAGGTGSEWLYYEPLSMPIWVNLSTGVASRLSGGVTHLANSPMNVIGSAVGGDIIIGDASGGVLEAHNGGNTIEAGSGRTIIIGGYGKNFLVGGPADDLIIGGATVYDYDILTLTGFLNEWQSPKAFGTRVYDLRSGTGQGGGHALILNVTVICPSGSSPGPRFGRGGGEDQTTMIGNGGDNWFFTLYPTTVVDLKSTDAVD